MPQDILGPFLFNMYVNNIYSDAPSALFINYADDTSIFFPGDSSNEIIAAANLAPIKPRKLKVPKMKAVMFYTNNKNIVAQTVIVLRSIPVEILRGFKTLGVIFQEAMSWNAHVDSITKKLPQLVGTIFRTCHVFPCHILMLIYSILFSSRLSYCHLVWASTTK